MGWKFACLLLLLITKYIEGQRFYQSSCTSFQDRKSPTCVVIVNCDGSIRYTDSTFSDISCMNSYYRYRNYDANFDLILNFQNMDLNVILYNPLLPNYLSSSKVKQIKLTNFEIIRIPSQILDFNEMTHFEITKSALESIDLHSFSGKDSLVSINASNNRISVLEDESILNSVLYSLKVIDLSFNLIQILPNNYFFRFPNLSHLNLSHNYIEHFEILTFEGLSHLETLYLSHNVILSIGHSFVRFGNLKELMLDHNQITFLKETNFNKMTQLQKLNLSSNRISDIEDSTFQPLFQLNALDLSDNAIPLLSNQLFQSNTKLEVLILSCNNISTISKGLFSEMNVTDFKINNNRISGVLDRDTFQGISESDFDLSKNKIEALGGEAFSSFGSELNHLNLSHNEIVNISSSAFSSTEYIITLDLSHNKLHEINGYFKSLKEMKYLNVSNNCVTRLLKVSLENLNSLIFLDLSFNSIKSIEDGSFNDLRNLETLLLCNNPLSSSFTLHTLRGMVSLKSIFLMNTGSPNYEQYAFSGMKDLQVVNSSYGGLITLDHDAFNDTGAIEILDFSHNLLENFFVNNESVPELKKLYLHNNRIQNITRKMFEGFSKLVKLTLSVNHIVQVEDNSFSSLSKLGYLDLSYNEFMTINGSQIESITSLYSLSLRGVKTSYNFSLVETASVQVVDMSLCNIDDIKATHIYQLTNLTDLNLSSNMISYVNKHSFQKMPVLSSVDLSFNHIKYIQPGSFIYTNLVKSINLHNNELTSLQYGVFDGLQNLALLNLSSNSLSSFEVNLLHNSPEVSVIALDNNFIKKIKLDSFNGKNIAEISLGGNLIDCDVFINLKYAEYSFKITAQALDYHSENVNGITCKTSSNSFVVQGQSNNTLIPNVTAAFDSLANAIGMFRNAIEHVTNSTVNDKETSNKEKENVLATINKLVKLYNDSQLLTNNLLQRMIDNNERKIEQVHVKNENTQVPDISTPVYVTLGFLLFLSGLCIFLSYSYLKWKSRLLDVNSFASNRHLANEIEME